MSYELPQRMKRLKTGFNELPVPYAMEATDDTGKPRLDPTIIVDCLLQKRCWVCYDKLGAHKAFLVEPVCAIPRTSVLPPAHLECAMFLADHNHAADVTLVYVTHTFEVMENSLFKIGEPEDMHFRHKGGEAAAEDVAASIEKLFPELLESCGDNAKAKQLICELHNGLMEMIPGMKTVSPRKVKLEAE